MKKTHFKKTALKYKDLVYSQAYYFINNREDAEDITQEVMMKLWRQIENIERSYVKAWLLRVTRNLCIDYSRRRRDYSLDDQNMESDGVQIAELIDPQANPEKEAINRDSLENVLKILNQLPEKMRNIVIMRDIQDLTYNLIAEAMDLPINSVKVYLHRGRKYLMKKYSDIENQSE